MENDRFLKIENWVRTSDRSDTLRNLEQKKALQKVGGVKNVLNLHF